MNNIVLVVSDNQGGDPQLERALMQAAPECRAKFASSIEEIKASDRPTIILLDLTLSRQSAFDVLRWLRADRQYQQTPVFVFGSEIVEHDANEAYALGANSCLRRSARDGFEPIAHAIGAYTSLLA
jgi:DNA-binding response OmpR family regulator